MSFIGAEHNLAQLDFPRKQVLYLSKAYNICSIDIASMNINNKQSFDKEIFYGIESGFDGKFLIHPRQIDGWLV